MLFSEPKIPQYRKLHERRRERPAVSVLFSEPKIPQFYDRETRDFAVEFKFQCSSASRKFLNPELNGAYIGRFLFQCSSASRKFLNPHFLKRRNALPTGFQCSSASRKFLNLVCQPRGLAHPLRVSVLFSEPKIPQCVVTPRASAPPRSFQCSSASRKFLNNVRRSARGWLAFGFSALQRAENSSIGCRRYAVGDVNAVSVLFSEPKIPQSSRFL